MFQFHHTYAQLPSILFSPASPTKASCPLLLCYNDTLADQLGLPTIPTKHLAQLLSGNELASGSMPIAQAYAGHQFGHFNILGDGRAILLGEHLTSENTHYDIVLKGAGRTPYSRRGDGRLALSPALREYLMCHAMHALNIPTTHTLAVVATGDSIFREQPESGAVLTRIADSHLRIGTFQWAAFTYYQMKENNNNKEEDSNPLSTLLDYALHRHYPECTQYKNPALAFLQKVGEKQVELVCEWLRVGFIHGVMNTDNCAIAGITLDYGPCAFMDHYDPATVYSFIDKKGRYAFGNQSNITLWNIARLAESLLPLLHPNHQEATTLAQHILDQLTSFFQKKYHLTMTEKMGLLHPEKEDASLIQSFLTYLQKEQLDYTNSFQALTHYVSGKPAPLLTENTALQEWCSNYSERLKKEHNIEESLAIMRQKNPIIIPRNHQIDRVLKAAELGELAPFENLYHMLSTPYTESPDKTPFLSPPTETERIQHTFCGT